MVCFGIIGRELGSVGLMGSIVLGPGLWVVIPFTIGSGGGGFSIGSLEAGPSSTGSAGSAPAPGGPLGPGTPGAPGTPGTPGGALGAGGG